MARVSCTFGCCPLLPHEHYLFDPPMPNQNTISIQKPILKKPRRQHSESFSVAIPNQPLPIKESPRIKEDFNFIITDSTDDLLLPTEMAAKVAANPQLLSNPKCCCCKNKAETALTSKSTKNPINNYPKRRLLDLPPLISHKENCRNNNFVKPNNNRLLDICPNQEKSLTPKEECSEFWEDSFIPVAFSNAARRYSTSELPPTCDTPSRLMFEMKLQEAKEELEHLKKKWSQTINECKENAKKEMKELLRNHAEEMVDLEEEFDVHSDIDAPQFLEVTREGEERVLFAKRVCESDEEMIEEEEDVPPNYAARRRELVEKQTREVIDMNTDFNIEMDNLARIKEKELERAFSKIGTLISEFNALPGSKKLNEESYYKLKPTEPLEKRKVTRLVLQGSV